MKNLNQNSFDYTRYSDYWDCVLHYIEDRYPELWVTISEDIEKEYGDDRITETFHGFALWAASLGICYNNRGDFTQKVDSPRVKDDWYLDVPRKNIEPSPPPSLDIGINISIPPSDNEEFSIRVQGDISTSNQIIANLSAAIRLYQDKVWGCSLHEPISKKELIIYTCENANITREIFDNQLIYIQKFNEFMSNEYGEARINDVSVLILSRLSLEGGESSLGLFAGINNLLLLAQDYNRKNYSDKIGIQYTIPSSVSIQSCNSSFTSPEELNLTFVKTRIESPLPCSEPITELNLSLIGEQLKINYSATSPYYPLSSLKLKINNNSQDLAIGEGTTSVSGFYEFTKELGFDKNKKYKVTLTAQNNQLCTAESIEYFEDDRCKNPYGFIEFILSENKRFASVHYYANGNQCKLTTVLITVNRVPQVIVLEDNAIEIESTYDIDSQTGFKVDGLNTASIFIENECGCFYADKTELNREFDALNLICSDPEGELSLSVDEETKELIVNFVAKGVGFIVKALAFRLNSQLVNVALALGQPVIEGVVRFGVDQGFKIFGKNKVSMEITNFCDSTTTITEELNHEPCDKCYIVAPLQYKIRPGSDIPQLIFQFAEDHGEQTWRNPPDITITIPNPKFTNQEYYERPRIPGYFHGNFYQRIYFPDAKIMSVNNATPDGAQEIMDYMIALTTVPETSRRTRGENRSQLITEKLVIPRFVSYYPRGMQSPTWEWRTVYDNPNFTGYPLTS